MNNNNPNSQKPICKLIGENGNIFNLISIAKKTLIKEGMKDEANELVSRLNDCKDYDEALALIQEYVDIE